MKSIFILNNYGISMTVLKKIYELGITYLDLEFFGESILKEKGISTSQRQEIIKAFWKSKNDQYAYTNIINELQFYYIKRNVLMMMNDRKVVLNDISALNEDEFCVKYAINPKYYQGIKTSYEMLKNNNFHIPKKDDYSDYLLKAISSLDDDKDIEMSKILCYLLNTTYPISHFYTDISKLERENKIKVIDEKISLIFPSILLRIQDLNEQHKNILLERLSGQTLKQVGDKYNLTRERIRQIIEKEYMKIEKVAEDKYKHIYEKYDLSENEFLTIFNEKKSTYYYLFDKYQKGKLNFVELEKEYFNNEDILKRIKSLKKEIYIDNMYIIGDRANVTKYYLKYKCNNEIKVKDLFYRINDFIINDLSNYKIDIYESIHNLEGFLERQSWCISGNKYNIRYYEMELLSENDLINLKEMLNVEYGLYSSLYFYENNKDLMEELNIKNEQELHNLLRNLIFLDNVTYLRMPNILIGYKNRKDFFEDKMTELAPLSVSDFLKILRNNYGHREDTMASYLALEFKEYITGDKIIANVVELPTDYLDNIISKLNKNVYSINEFREILNNFNLSSNNTQQILNNLNLSKLNYKIIGNYIIKNNYNNLEEAFYNAIIRGEISCSNLRMSSTTYAIISKLEKNYKIIEIDKKYYAFERLYNLGLTKNEIFDFINVIKETFSINNYYITPTLIRAKISHSLLQNKMINDSIICSLIKLIDGFRKISWHNNIIFCYCPKGNASRKTFLLSILEENKDIKLSEVQNILKEKYGVILNEEQIRYIGYDIGVLFNNDDVNHY